MESLGSMVHPAAPVPVGGLAAVAPEATVGRLEGRECPVPVDNAGSEDTLGDAVPLGLVALQVAGVTEEPADPEVHEEPRVPQADPARPLVVQEELVSMGAHPFIGAVTWIAAARARVWRRACEGPE